MNIKLPGNLPYYDLRLGRSDEYPQHYQFHLDLGPNAPVFAAKIRMDAPYPDVQVVLPIRPEAVVAYMRGDRSVLATLTEEIINAHRNVLRELAGS